MHTLMAGASGLIGSTVAQYLGAEGHEVVRLVRQAPGEGEILSDPGVCTIGGPGLKRLDAASIWPEYPGRREGRPSSRSRYARTGSGQTVCWQSLLPAAPASHPRWCVLAAWESILHGGTRPSPRTAPRGPASWPTHSAMARRLQVRPTRLESASFICEFCQSYMPPPFGAARAESGTVASGRAALDWTRLPRSSITFSSRIDCPAPSTSAPTRCAMLTSLPLLPKFLARNQACHCPSSWPISFGARVQTISRSPVVASGRADCSPQTASPSSLTLRVQCVMS
jgi:hypothetical protein